MSYRLLSAFESLFVGQQYLHRRSNLGDFVAMHFYEDMYELGRSARFVKRVDDGLAVLNTKNTRHGVKARRGDGSFGELLPQQTSVSDPGFHVQRGPIATIEVGIEVKILMKAMIKQIDRVISDLKGQAAHFRSHGGKPFCIGIVGINHADRCTTYEGDRSFPTDGRQYKHPIQEASDAEERLLRLAAPAFDEFIILPFRATNTLPYEFEWVDSRKAAMDLGAALARASSAYQNG